MSSQSQDPAGEGGIPLSVARHQQQFRLLELPAELLELLSSPNPPCLSIKSTGLSKDGQDEQKLVKSSSAVLCTDTKTFLLRQVQTSNSMHILQSSIQARVDGLSSVGVATAIAQCGTIVELAPSSDSALRSLQDMLPPWSQNGLVPNHRKWNKRTVFSNLPFSNGELQKAWIECFAFERDGGSWIPSARDVLDVWNTLLMTAKAGVFNLDEPLGTNMIWETIRDDGAQFPREMYQAFVERFTTYEDLDGHMDIDGVINKSCSIDRTALIQWLGAQIFVNMTNAKGNVLVEDFIAKFEEELPLTWQNEAKLEVIQDLYYIQTESVLAPISNRNDHSPQASQASASSASSRKWHERFGKARRP